MAVRYFKTTIGTFTVVQQNEGEDTPRRYKIQIRQGNCLAVFLNVRKVEDAPDPAKPWYHDMICFFVDDAHIKRCFKGYKSGDRFKSIFAGKITNIKLNMFYKENTTLLKHFVRDGYRVQCYYKEVKK